MKLPHRRQFLHLAAGAAVLPAVSHFAWAQAYPSRAVRIIVGFAPGGAYDIVARLMGQWLSERLGQAFVIENRPGAGSNIGTEAVVNASADGHTLLMVSTANAVNATLYEKLNYNYIRDIVPVAGVTRVANVMLVNLSFPTKTIPSLSPMPSPTQAGSTWRPAASVRPIKFRASCSRSQGSLFLFTKPSGKLACFACPAARR
jgi:tripartite-type tricarboxylate transporter receptor subunit TctC